MGDGECVLAKANLLIEAYGGFSVAGDAKDQFHQRIMSDEEMTEKRKGWRPAWKGKAEAAIKREQKGKGTEAPVVGVTIDSGPECQWEYQELTTTFKDCYPGLHIRRFKDFQTFE